LLLFLQYRLRLFQLKICHLILHHQTAQRECLIRQLERAHALRNLNLNRPDG